MKKKIFVKLSKSVKKAQGMSSSRVFEYKEANTSDVSEHKELIYLRKNIKKALQDIELGNSKIVKII